MGRNVTDFSKLEKNKEAEKYRENIKMLYIILGTATVFFYVVPLVLGITIGHSGDIWTKVLVPMLLINVNPIIVFISCVIHSRKFGFGFLTPAVISMFFIPTALIFYGPEMALFAIVYFVLGMFGELAGYLFILRKKKNKAPIGMNRHVKASKKGNRK